MTVPGHLKGVKVLLAHDTEVGLVSAAALVNTVRPGHDDLASTADLDRFVERWGWTGGRTHDAAELAGVRELRGRLRPLWSADKDQVVDTVNDLLREAGALPQLVRHDGWGYHVHATPSDAPLADRMAVEAAMAVVDLVRTDQLERLRVCAADDCEDVVVDLTRNHSRRFCDRGCGNRLNVAAYRARRRA
jgi:predicted RNA-binding Zn ribbon-like protein